MDADLQEEIDADLKRWHCGNSKAVAFKKTSAGLFFLADPCGAAVMALLGERSGSASERQWVDGHQTFGDGVPSRWHGGAVELP